MGYGWLVKAFENMKSGTLLITSKIYHRRVFQIYGFAKQKQARCVCETRKPPQQPFFQKLLPWYLTLTLTDDLDFCTEERVLPQGINNLKYESSITYHSKAMSNVKVLDKQTGQKLYAPDLLIWVIKRYNMVITSEFEHILLSCRMEVFLGW